LLKNNKIYIRKRGLFFNLDGHHELALDGLHGLAFLLLWRGGAAVEGARLEQGVETPRPLC
jgi:hypothetical protein